MDFPLASLKLAEIFVSFCRLRRVFMRSVGDQNIHYSNSESIGIEHYCQHYNVEHTVTQRHGSIFAQAKVSFGH